MGLESVKSDVSEELSDDEPAVMQLGIVHLVSVENLQGVCVDEETSELGRCHFVQIHWHRRLKHTNTHTGEQLGDKPVFPIGRKRLEEKALKVEDC